MALDRDLNVHHAELAAKASLLPGLDLRLAYIDTDAGRDDFHVLQGLKDDILAETTAACCYVWQRWGGTGARGANALTGPDTKEAIKEQIAAVFLEKTGSEFGTVKPGDEAKEGMFWLQQASAPDSKAQWQYYVGDGVDGKAPGWYPYTEEANNEVEEIYAQHVANERNQRTALRIVSSGYFSYKVDLTEMKQTNTRTNKVREIRRATGEEVQGADMEAESYAKRKAKAAAKKVVEAKRAPKAKPAPAAPAKKVAARKGVKKTIMKSKEARKAKKIAAKAKAKAKARPRGRPLQLLYLRRRKTMTMRKKATTTMKRLKRKRLRLSLLQPS
mmetsp:Transcript_9846/g.22018  ORF Transcript_9846/g.22018 Transcript_9846/m.22018 type:complete len:330 (+) Transcript_9846:79-1068(+)